MQNLTIARNLGCLSLQMSKYLESVKVCILIPSKKKVSFRAGPYFEDTSKTRPGDLHGMAAAVKASCCHVIHLAVIHLSAMHVLLPCILMSFV
jgi:hypothetical protein